VATTEYKVEGMNKNGISSEESILRYSNFFLKKGSCLEVAMEVKSNNVSLCSELSEGAF